jgi:hypothetical protein
MIDNSKSQHKWILSFVRFCNLRWASKNWSAYVRQCCIVNRQPKRNKSSLELKLFISVTNKHFRVVTGYLSN